MAEVLGTYGAVGGGCGVARAWADDVRESRGDEAPRVSASHNRRTRGCSNAICTAGTLIELFLRKREGIRMNSLAHELIDTLRRAILTLFEKARYKAFAPRMHEGHPQCGINNLPSW
jgi:hypothetical protein